MKYILNYQYLPIGAARPQDDDAGVAQTLLQRGVFSGFHQRGAQPVANSLGQARRREQPHPARQHKIREAAFDHGRKLRPILHALTGVSLKKAVLPASHRMGAKRNYIEGTQEGVPMSTISKEYRDQAKDAAERAKTAHSDEEGYMQRKRQKALNEMADNENWLDGEPKEYTETVNDHRKRPRDPSQPI